MNDPRHALLERLERTLVEQPGACTPAQRQAALEGKGEGALGEWAALVEANAFRATDERVAALSAAHGDDAVFELTLAAAHGAARRRLEAGLRALDEAFGADP